MWDELWEELWKEEEEEEEEEEETMNSPQYPSTMNSPQYPSRSTIENYYISSEEDEVEHNRLGAVTFAYLADIDAELLHNLHFGIKHNVRMQLESDGEKDSVPILFIRGGVLFPGISLNLETVNAMQMGTLDIAQAMQREAMQQREAKQRGASDIAQASTEDVMIGLVLVYISDDLTVEFETVGVTAEIITYNVNDGKVLLRGSRRFCLKHITLNDDGIPFGSIHLLGEDKPFEVPPLVRQGMPVHTPKFAYTTDDSNRLSQKVADLRKPVLGGASLDDATLKDPALLSYRVASELPVSIATKLRLLEKETVSERLQEEINLIDRFDSINCRECNHQVAKRRDMPILYNNGPYMGWRFQSVYSSRYTRVLKGDGAYLNHHTPLWKRRKNPKYDITSLCCVSCNSEIGEELTHRRESAKLKTFWHIDNLKIKDFHDF